MEIPDLTLATLANSLAGPKREFSNKPLRQKDDYSTQIGERN